MMDCTVILLAGGSGTRLWPLSRRVKPKQVIALDGDESLLQVTAKRLLRHIDPARVVTMTHQDQASLVLEHLGHVAPDLCSHVLSEPVAKNTLPAIAWAVAKIHQDDPDAVVGVFPSDHLIADEREFTEAFNLSVEVAKRGYVTLFGITADSPSVEYGYIQAKSDVAGFDSGRVKAVNRFVEKPDAETAKRYLSEGGYYWNSGMFVFKAAVFLSLLQKYQPQIYGIALQLAQTGSCAGDIKLYEQFPSISIDYGLMEHVNNAVVIPVSMGWSDLGGWGAVYRYLDKDIKGNVTKGETLVVDSDRSIIWNDQEGEMIVAYGIKDLVIVRSQGVTLVCPRDKVAEIGGLTKRVAQRAERLV
ncbi:MAG: mannose-1-phosphate guanylyltransferase [Deltaproteobacteria bacterium]|nr:mannose-1-phosphate guanylyltransferase [Deltaproteobacteria bacterium]